MAAVPPLDDELRVEIDIPVDQVPEWLRAALGRADGRPWPYVSLMVTQARFEQPITIESGAGSARRLKATLLARGVSIIDAMEP